MLYFIQSVRALFHTYIPTAYTRVIFARRHLEHPSPTPFEAARTIRPSPYTLGPQPAQPYSEHVSPIPIQRPRRCRNGPTDTYNTHRRRQLQSPNPFRPFASKQSTHLIIMRSLCVCVSVCVLFVCCTFCSRPKTQIDIS